jgi:predicted Zn finger-like uncharacterized protein
MEDFRCSNALHSTTMYTCCPHCAAVFRVSAALLGQAGGRARCGECREAFNVVDELYEDLVSARDAAAAISKPHAAQPGVPGAAEGRETVPVIPDYYQDNWRPRAFSGRDVMSAFSIILLAVLLGLQWLWFNRATLATQADWRPVLEELCAVVHCELPLRVDLSQLAIINRDVRQHPAASEALLINAVFENRADFIQPYPFFEVSFIDSTGSPVAMRRFRPEEYLDEDVKVALGMAPQAPVQVVLEVMDPGEAAVSFQFDFL